MAQLIETMAVIKISRLIKDNEAVGMDIDKDLFDQLEPVIAELIGDDKALIEVIRPD